MKEYPTIEYWNHGIMNSPVIAFNKMDGSNIRCEWSKKRGFYKFGTRHNMIDKNSDFWPAVILFLEKYDEPLNRLFRDHKDYRNIQSITTYSEYYGENSFAGMHKSDDIMQTILFDVWLHQKGWVEPRKFKDDFMKFGIPSVVYEGNLNHSFIQMVKNNEFDNLKEGVVAKGIQETKRVDKRVWMVKIKTNAWLDRLKNKFGEEALKEELNNDLTIL
jgi:hypothetical protein